MRGTIRGMQSKDGEPGRANNGFVVLSGRRHRLRYQGGDTIAVQSNHFPLSVRPASLALPTVLMMLLAALLILPGPRPIPPRGGSNEWNENNLIPTGNDMGEASLKKAVPPTPLTASPGWSELYEPPQRSFAAMVNDSTDGYELLFGGLSPTGAYLNDTWKGVEVSQQYETPLLLNWTRLSPPVSPPARDRAVMAYDWRNGQVLLFGGYDGSPMGDTWTYSAGFWSRYSGPAPLPRYDAAMAYDSADNEVVLFGGNNGTSSLNDTWIFSGGSWKEIFPATAPSPRWGAALSDDPPDAEVILFGGIPGAGETWVFHAENWTELHPSTSPTARYWASMVYSPSLSKVLLVGGYNGGPVHDMWTFSAGSWSSVFTPVFPAAYGMAASSDVNGQCVFYFGGNVTSSTGSGESVPLEMQKLNFGVAWPGNTPPARFDPEIAYDPSTGETFLYGGEVGSTTITIATDAWSYDAGTWTQLTSGASSNFALPVWAPMVYDARDGYFLMFGGNCAITSVCPENVTATYSAGTWTALPTSIAPSPRWASDMAYDPADGNVVLFGGYNGHTFLNDTWTYAGGIWTNITQTAGTPPPARAGFGLMTYDAANQMLVLFGGQESTGFLNDTWTFSSGKWHQVDPSTPPPARNDAPLVYDPVLGSVLLIAGHGNTQALGDMWAFSHGNWTELLPSVPFSYRWAYGAVFDAADNEVLLFGGTNTSSGTYLGDTWTYRIPPFSASIASNATRGDVGERYAFSAGAENGVAPYNFSWEFGDGSHRFGANVTHAFAVPGNFQVQVFANDSNGHSLVREINVTVAGALAAHPSAAPNPALIGETVLFDANASGGTVPINYTWLFGDASPPSYLPAPTHAYRQQGNYTVELIVSDSAGVRLSKTFPVKVVAGPFSAFASATPTIGNTPLTVAFNSSLEGGILPYSQLWSFGDGTGSTQADPVHIYNSTGTFFVKLFASDGSGTQVVRYINVTVLGSQPLSVSATESSETGTTPLEVAFTGLATGGAGGGYEYLWNFGDGSTGQGPQANHTYTAPGIFTTTVSVSDSQGDYAEYTLPAITIAQPSAPPSLIGHASAIPETGTPPVTVPFTSSVSGGAPPYTYDWHFGDGANSTFADPAHTYVRYGVYNVTLWINDSSSPVQSTLSTLTIEILRPGTGTLHLMVAASPVSGYAPMTATFSVAESGGSGSYPYVSWSFGDGTFASGNAASHIFLSRGIYHVSVAVTDSLGNSVSTSFNVTVLTPPLHAYAGVMQYTGIAPLTITFNASAEGGTGADYTFRWSFSNGGTATGSVVQHQFATGGTFAAVVTVTDSAGNTAVATLNVTLAAPPHPEPMLFGLPTPYAYSLIGGVVAVLAILLGALYLRKRAVAERSRPKVLPSWPEEPLTILETSERGAVLRMAASAPLPKESVLLLVRESPEVVEKAQGLQGMKIVQAAVSEGENKVKPGDLDRVGHLLEDHLRSGEGKTVVIEALDMIIDANQVKGARRLLDVVREVAQENKGRVLVQLNPSSLSREDRTRLEEGAHVLQY